LLGGVLEMFVSVSDVQHPTNDPSAENLYISMSYDATSHFESSSRDVLNMYEAITGEKLDLDIQPPEDEDEY